MSAANQEYIDRFNKYKGRLDSAGAAVISATQYLTRATEGFPTHSHATIGAKWREWRDEEQCFYRMTDTGSAPTRVFPMPPEGGAPPGCWHMWGLLIQVQVDGTHGKTEFLRKIVAEIVADEECATHPATCPCKLPDNPWVYLDDVEALAPLKVKHSPKCQCAGFRRCTQMEEAIAAQKASISAAWKTVKEDAEAELAAKPELKVGPCRCDAQYCNISCSCLPGRIADAKKEAEAKPMVGGSEPKPVVASPHTRGSYYTHNVDTCACGTCYKSRVDSGTEQAYAKRCKDAADAVMAKMAKPLQRVEPPPLQRQNSVMGLLQAATNADTAIAKASAASGGTNHPDFAKALFAAMGTPHDSKCPHGMPFYACMPCSH